MYKLSFIIPTYNVENYLERCIDSILSMNIPKEEYEIIIVDDGSSDRTIEIIKKIDNIKTYFFDKPSGFAGRPRNKGLEISTGTHIAFIDPDDWYIGTSLYDAYKEYRGGYDLIINSFIFQTREEKRVLKSYNPQKELWEQLQSVFLQRMIFSKGKIMENKIRFVENCRGQDLVFLYEFYSKTQNIKFTKKISTVYMDDRQLSVSNNINNKYIESSLILFDELYKRLKGVIPDNELHELILEHFCYYYYVLKKEKKITKELKVKISKRKFYMYLKKV